MSEINEDIYWVLQKKRLIIDCRKDKDFNQAIEQIIGAIKEI